MATQLRTALKAIGYARVVPTDSVAEALAHQRARIEDYCSKNALELVKVFEEVVSGELELDPGRPKLDAALSALQEPYALVVVRADRISQKRTVLLAVNDICTTKQISVHTMHGPTDLRHAKTSIEVTVIR